MILDWPIRSGLLAFRDRLREAAAAAYHADRLLYVLGGLKDEPKPDPILRD